MYPMYFPLPLALFTVLLAPTDRPEQERCIFFLPKKLIRILFRTPTVSQGKWYLLFLFPSGSFSFSPAPSKRAECHKLIESCSKYPPRRDPSSHVHLHGTFSDIFSLAFGWGTPRSGRFICFFHLFHSRAIFYFHKQKSVSEFLVVIVRRIPSATAPPSSDGIQSSRAYVNFPFHPAVILAAGLWHFQPTLVCHVNTFGQPPSVDQRPWSPLLSLIYSHIHPASQHERPLPPLDDFIKLKRLLLKAITDSSSLWERPTTKNGSRWR